MEKLLKRLKRRETWLHHQDAAAYLGVKEKWLRAHTGSYHGLPGLQYGRRTWFRLKDLERWLESSERILQSGALHRRQLNKLQISWAVRLPKRCQL